MADCRRQNRPRTGHCQRYFATRLYQCKLKEAVWQVLWSGRLSTWEIRVATCVRYGKGQVGINVKLWTENRDCANEENRVHRRVQEVFMVGAKTAIGDTSKLKCGKRRAREKLVVDGKVRRLWEGSSAWWSDAGVCRTGLKLPVIKRQQVRKSSSVAQSGSIYAKSLVEQCFTGRCTRRLYRQPRRLRLILFPSRSEVQVEMQQSWHLQLEQPNSGSDAVHDTKEPDQIFVKAIIQGDWCNLIKAKAGIMKQVRGQNRLRRYCQWHRWESECMDG